MSATETAPPAMPFAHMVEMADRSLAQYGASTYSDLILRNLVLADRIEGLIASLERNSGVTTLLYGGLRAVTEHAAAAEVCLRHNREELAEEALERAAMGRKIGNDLLARAEGRGDLHGVAENVEVLARAREARAGRSLTPAGAP